MEQLSCEGPPNKRARLAQNHGPGPGNSPGHGHSPGHSHGRPDHEGQGLTSAGLPQTHMTQPPTCVTQKTRPRLEKNRTAKQLRKASEPVYSQCPSSPSLISQSLSREHSNMVATEPDKKAAMFSDSACEQYTCCDAVTPDQSGTWTLLRRHRRALGRHSLERLSGGPDGVPMSPYRVSPYSKTEILKWRKCHERERKIRRLEDIKCDVKEQQEMVRRNCQQEIPRPRLKEETKNNEMPQNGSILQDSDSEDQSAGATFETENQKYIQEIAALRLKIQELQKHHQGGTVHDHAQEVREELEGTEKGLFETELITQLMDDYADSQTMLKTVGQLNKEYAEKVDKMDAQLAVFENRHQDDRVSIETQDRKLKQIRAEYTDKVAGMCQHIEALERRHREDSLAIDKQRQHLARMNDDHARNAESRRLEMERYEQIQQDSRREIAAQQQTLSGYCQQLERLQALVVRQRECLECSICLGTFVQPITLNCSHTFCEDCIESSRQTAIQPDSCPLCRQLIRTASRSTVLSQLAEITQGLELCGV